MADIKTEAGKALRDMGPAFAGGMTVTQFDDYLAAIEAQASQSFWPTPEQADDLIRTWLSSPEAERDLAEALPMHEDANHGVDPDSELHRFCTMYARAILTSLRERLAR